MNIMRPGSDESLNSDWGTNTTTSQVDMDNQVLGGQEEKLINMKPHAQVHLLSPVDKCKVRWPGNREQS